MAGTSQTPPLYHQFLSRTPNYTSDDIESIDEEVPEEDHHPSQVPHLHSFIGNNNMQHHHEVEEEEDQKSTSNKRYRPLLILNFILLFVGSVSSSLLSKYYFIHKGSSKWVSTWVQCAGFPILLIPIFLYYTERKPFTDFTKNMFWCSFFVGLMLGLNNFLISWGVAYLPVSTSALLLSSQLGFNLILSAIIVKQKITYSNLNAVILITTSSVILAVNNSHEMPQGVSSTNNQKNYIIGCFCTIGAGFLFALYLPIMESIYKRVYCYQMVMEIQLVIEVAATVLATVGMVCNGGFSEMKDEAERVFDMGPTVYWLTIVTIVVTWQCCFMGTAGMVFMTCSLTGGVASTALLAANVFAGWLVYHDVFRGFKVLATGLCIWGFSSYVYGLFIERCRKKEEAERRNSGGGSTTELIPNGN